MVYGSMIGNFVKAGVKKIPWGNIFGAVGPAVLGSATDKIQELIGKIGRSSQPGANAIALDGLEKRLTQLEQGFLVLGPKVPELEAKQQQQAEIIKTLSARVIILTVVTGFALVVSVGAVVILLFK